MTPGEPQSAAEYDDRTTAAVKMVLVEIGQILGSFKGKFAIVGGAVPWLLLANEEMPHVGTLDVDIGLDSEALGDGEYPTSSKPCADMVMTNALSCDASNSFARFPSKMAARLSMSSLTF